jgi:hypothetical protein
MKHPLVATFEGPDLSALAEPIVAWRCFGGAPRLLHIREEDRAPSGDWKRQLTEAQSGAATFSALGAGERRACRVGIASGRLVTAVAPDVFSTVGEVLALIEQVPFTVVSFGEVFPDEWRDTERDTFGFANGHTRLGWGCAFKGAGHDRLVSRRWLDFGPWRVLRGAGDLTLVQFHDLALTDPAAALAQALPGHERMGISEIGGFIQGRSAAGRGIKYVVREKLPEGFYDARTRTLEVVVPPGRAISQGEMLDACAYRVNKRADQTTPIERVAYVFIDEASARAHLHEMWLRELEVWTVEGGDKRRLDLDHHPIPTPPGWVRDLEGAR